MEYICGHGNGFPGSHRPIWVECIHLGFGLTRQMQILWMLGDMGFKLQPSICKVAIGLYGYPEHSLVKTVVVAMSRSLIFFDLDPAFVT